MKHCHFTLSVVVLLVVWLLPLGGICAADSSGSDSFRVGLILPLTGRASSLGTAILNGAQLALDSLPPEVRSGLEVAVEDDGSESKNSVTAYRKLQSDRGLGIVVSALSNAGNVITPLSERDGVPHISIALDQKISKGKTRTFTFWASSEKLSAVAVPEARRRGYRNVALVTTSHEGNIAMRNALVSASGDLMTYLLSEELLPTDRDFSTVITRMKRFRNLDAVANLLHPAQAGLFFRQAWDQGLHVPQFCLANFEDLGVRQVAGSSLQGQWYVAAEYSDDFIERYTARFPKKSVMGAAYGHDAVLLIANFIARRNGGGDVVNFLRNVKGFDGAMKSLSADGQNGFQMTLEVKVVGKDGF